MKNKPDRRSFLKSIGVSGTAAAPLSSGHPDKSDK
jgi:hypothetical protein